MVQYIFTLCLSDGQVDVLIAALTQFRTQEHNSSAMTQVAYELERKIVDNKNYAIPLPSPRSHMRINAFPVEGKILMDHLELSSVEIVPNSNTNDEEIE